MPFDAQALLNQTFSQALSTSKPTFEPGIYLGKCGKPSIMNGTTKDGKPWARLNTTIELDVPGYAEEHGAAATARYGVFLDCDEEGNLKMGDADNNQLARFLEACDCNEEGMSLMSIEGRFVWAKAELRALDDGTTVNDVTRVYHQSDEPR